MEEKQMINVIKEDGTPGEAEVLLNFTLDLTGKEYLLYTFNEVDDKGLVTVHASTVNRSEDGHISLEGIATDEEWSEIKRVMKEVIKQVQASKKGE